LPRRRFTFNLAMNPYFTAESVKVAYESRFHFGWYAHGRHPFSPSVRPCLEESLRDVCERRNYHLLEFDLGTNVLRALLSLRPEISPAEATRFVKGNLASAARNQCGERNLWSRGCFVRSVGHVTSDTVRRYVASQQERHGAIAIENPPAARACHASPGDPSALRTSDHAKFEYNLHFVFVVSWRRELLDQEIAEELVSYWRRVCEKKHWIAWNVEVVGNHAHLFLGLSPDDAPAAVALNLLNNGEFHLQRRYAAALREEVGRTVWQPGYYAGTVGSATTAQVKAFLG
jgi:REP-associated tyrosine transposase